MAKNKEHPLISVGIPTYNRGNVLFNTIDDVLTQSTQNFELIIVDQSITRDQDYIEKLKLLQKDPRVKYFYVKPPSVTTARNFALAHASAEYIVFLDDDVQIKKDLLERFLNCFETHPTVSAIGGRVMQDGFPVLDKILHFNELMVSDGVFTSLKSGYTNAFAGGNCALVVSDALEVGGFDTRYRGNSFREESDMAMKMIKAGMKIYYEPTAELVHLSAPSGGNRVQGDIWDNPGTYVNEIFFTIRFASKHKKWQALKTKYDTFTDVPSRRIAYKRRWYFISGVFRAYLRLLFMPQRKAVEIL